MNRFILCFCLVVNSMFFVTDVFPMVIDRVILSSDNNENYLPFWPLVAKAWKEIVGVRPTLALIASNDVQVDESYGDVIRFEPIEGVPTSLQAQVIRLFLPALFEDEVSIIADIDMFPMSREYFLGSVKNISDNCFVTFKDQADDYYKSKCMYPMCYNVAKGKVFKEIFNIRSKEDISDTIKKWSDLNLGWNTDEIMLARTINNWKDKDKHFVKLGHGVNKRIDRINWKYKDSRVKKCKYHDAALLRPYKTYKKEIDRLARLMNIKS